MASELLRSHHRSVCIRKLGVRMRLKHVVAVLVLFLGIQIASTRAQAVATWIDGNGNWSDAANWSTCVPAVCPVVPNNSGGTSYDVLIDVPDGSGSQPVVAFDANGTVIDNLTVGLASFRDNGQSSNLTVLGSFETNGQVSWETGILNVGGDFRVEHLGAQTTIGGSGILNIGGSLSTGETQFFIIESGGVVNIGQDYVAGDAAISIGGTMKVGGTYFADDFGGATNVSGLLVVGSDLYLQNLRNGIFGVNGGTVLVNGNLFIDEASALTDNGTVSINGSLNNSGGGVSIGGNLTVLSGFANNGGTVLVQKGGTLFASSYSQVGGSTAISGVLVTNSYQQSSGSTTVETGGLVKATTFTATGGTVTVNGILDPTAVEIDSGATLQGTGTIIGNLAMGGTLLPGGPGTPGTLTIVGNYEQLSTGMLQELMGPLSRSFLNVTGDVALDGNSFLNIILLNGFDPLGQTFSIMDYSSLVGQFSNGSSFWQDGFLWDIHYGQHEIDVTAVQTPEPSPLVLLAVGFLAIGGFARRKMVAE